MCEHKGSTPYIMHDYEFEEHRTKLDMIDGQVGGVIVKARAIRRGLYCLLAATMAFLL